MNDLVIHNARLYPMSYNSERSTANQIAVLDGKNCEISDQLKLAYCLQKNTTMLKALVCFRA